MPESRHRRSRGQALSRRARSAGTLANARPRRKKTNKLYLMASAVIAVLVIAGFAVGGLAGGGTGGGGNIGQATSYVDGVGARQSILPTRNHMPEGQSISYGTVFPTSGDHWDTPEACGFYEDELPNERIVHNLEHGNIVVSYNLATEDEVDQLRSAISSIGLSNIWGVTRFQSELPLGQVTASAWGVLDEMTGIDRDRLSTFFTTYAGTLGPERLVCSSAQQHVR